jgi:exopolysaccharide biosynthesis WecB/TagA/CpsF family protein
VTAAAPPVDILGVPFERLTPQQALERVAALYERPDPATVLYANANTLNLAFDDHDYLRVLQRADLVLNDGKGVMLAARLRGRRFPADLNGNFFTPLVLERAAVEGWPTFLFGAKPGVAQQVAQRLTERLSGLSVVGVRDGYAAADDERAAVDAIRSSGATLLLVGLGNPRQERWLHRNLAATGARLGLGVGAFLDFQAGTVARAPAWMNRVGLEWLHRLALEPRRMWRRYLVGNPLFLARALLRRDAPAPAPGDGRPSA